MPRFEDLKVEYVPLDSLKPYDGNAKKHTREQIDAVENSIKEFGFRNPIIAWHNDDGLPEIVAGHARAKAAQNLGMETVPVIFVDDLSDAQRRALTLADNQTTMMTGWDMDQLSYELETLEDVFDMDDFGFDPISMADNRTEQYKDTWQDEDKDVLDAYAQDADGGLKSFNVIISCMSDDEREWVASVLGVDPKGMKRLYHASELMAEK